MGWQPKVSRRAMAANLLAPGLVTAGVAMRAQAASVSFDHLFVNLAGRSVAPEVKVIHTRGYSANGVGAALYVDATGEALPESGKAVWWQVIADGRRFRLAEDEPTVEMFGAIGGAPDRDDHPGIAATLAWLIERGGGVLRCRPGAVYYLSQTVTIDPTLISLEGNGATWDFRNKPVVAGSDDVAANACLLVRGSGPQYGHDYHYCRGLNIVGPTGQDALADGIVMDTSLGLRSSRWTFENVQASKNLARGLVLATRAYLVKSISCTFIGATAGVEYLPGEDSGENFSFYGCNLGGGIGLKNTGKGEFYLYGASIDFPKQFIQSQGGSIHCYGCHFENHDLAQGSPYPFDVDGDLYISGGRILIGINSPVDHTFYTRGFSSRVFLQEVSGFGWPSAKGELVGGKGRAHFRGLLGGSIHSIDGVVKRDDKHNALGPAGRFEQTDIHVDGWASGGAKRVDRHAVSWGDAVGRVQTSTDAAHSGSRSLKIAKPTAIGQGTPFDYRIAAPIRAGQPVAMDFWYLIRGGQKASNASVAFQIRYASLIGRAEFGVPILGNDVLISEQTIPASAAADASEWKLFKGFAALNSQEGGSFDGFSPEWATHITLGVNMFNMPGEAQVFIDDLHVSVW